MFFAKVSLSTLAIAAIAATSLATPTSAEAVGVVRLSGATAFSINQARALKLLCTNAGGTVQIFKSGSSTTSLGNIFTVKCSVDFQNGGGVDEAQINVAGGSFSAVLNRTGNDGATPVPLYSAAACAGSPTLGAGTGPLSWAAAGELVNCPAATQISATTDGGILDVEGTVFTAKGLFTPSQVNPATDYIVSGFFQSFGIGATALLYNAMQAQQVARGRLPANCATVVTNAGVDTYTATGSTTPDCQPNLSRAAYTAMAVAGNNDIKRAGANHFIGGTNVLKNDLPANQAISPDMPLNTRFTLCRRVSTSGTQAAAELYILSNPTATGDLGGVLAPIGSATAQLLTGTGTSLGATFRSYSNSGSSDVRNCLNNASATSPYGAGVLSMENNPLGGSDTYRFVKINGASPSEGVAGAAQTAEAIAGRYDFVYEAVKYCPGGTCLAILDAIDTVLPPGSSTAGLFLRSETVFTRNGNANSPLRSK